MSIPVPHPVTRKQLIQEVNRRGLVSVMNDTKWLELIEAVKTELPFRPAYQLKLLLMDHPVPRDFTDDVPWFGGDWTREALWPYVEIEWIRFVPRILRNRGMLLSPAIESAESPLLDVLNRYQIPFRRDEKTIWVDGYISPSK